MWKVASTGAVLMIAGALRAAQHANPVPTLEDYLMFRCGPGAAASGVDAFSHSFLSASHCWGCAAMLIGAGLLVVAAVKPFPRDLAGIWRAK